MFDDIKKADWEQNIFFAWLLVVVVVAVINPTPYHCWQTRVETSKRKSSPDAEQPRKGRKSINASHCHHHYSSIYWL